MAALEGRLQQARIKLDDWTTCVSAKTSKGQAENRRAVVSLLQNKGISGK